MTSLNSIQYNHIYVEEGCCHATDLTWIMIASIQGYPVLPSLQAASNSSSSSFQGIYNNVQKPKIDYTYRI